MTVEVRRRERRRGADIERKRIQNYFKEVCVDCPQVKHGRVSMLAAVGFLVAEQFHPLFGGDIDVPAFIAYQQTPLQTFWTSVVASIGVAEFS